ncbi:hypothetical protein N8611_02305, partial [bacterium]|nr:hypothetical protein [bacterium]
MIQHSRTYESQRRRRIHDPDGTRDAGLIVCFVCGDIGKRIVARNGVIDASFRYQFIAIRLIIRI